MVSLVSKATKQGEESEGDAESLAAKEAQKEARTKELMGENAG